MGSEPESRVGGQGERAQVPIAGPADTVGSIAPDSKASTPRSGLSLVRSVLVSGVNSLSHLVGTVYVGAASLIGFEALAIVLGFTTAWPIAVPIVVGVLGLAYFGRGWLRAAWVALAVRLRR